MIPVIEQNRAAIERICRKHDVKQLELFGSAASGQFAAGLSDIDFFVEFNDYNSKSIADQWFGLQEELEQLLGAPVELVSLRTAKNPLFLQVANRYRISLYAA